MLGGNLGSLLYGDVSVMALEVLHYPGSDQTAHADMYLSCEFKDVMSRLIKV